MMDAFHKFIGGKIMKVMKILLISSVVIVGSLFLFNEKEAAGEGVVIGDIAILHTFNQETNNLELLVYHEPSNSLLIYGYSSKTKKGLRLLHVRRLEHDFAFVEKTIKKLDYKKDGYDIDRIKDLTKLRYTGDKER